MNVNASWMVVYTYVPYSAEQGGSGVGDKREQDTETTFTKTWKDNCQITLLVTSFAFFCIQYYWHTNISCSILVWMKIRTFSEEQEKQGIESYFHPKISIGKTQSTSDKFFTFTGDVFSIWITHFISFYLSPPEQLILQDSAQGSLPPKLHP